MNETEVAALVKQVREFLASKADEDMAWSILFDYNEGDITDILCVEEITDFEGAKAEFNRIHDKVLEVMTKASTSF
jgi:hypothetical protein